MKGTHPERAYVIEFTEEGNLDQECGGMPFNLSIIAHSEAQARQRFAEHMRAQHPGARFTIQQILMPLAQRQTASNSAQCGRC